ncbi:long-chain acyl-CoA synthetase [Parabacteroides sp. PF5-5]|uniref:AMP-dependent synthetase/ligase n=1 Tax=unclassified Parabacteroides TaxID=2649774 RepID=UPI00247421C7|nr:MULTISPECIES: AMP-binding protein [unclassified Parabacteroides]MDH6305154.1 long-chain acyl-CoA synthetase [Parabacteroides sp. PH5-39]MDH6316504.1 long-chain acyl-CoA synthetase [Parabacteroides sp. PF5-13]MDH6320014.1 long-chain acyl-CoA synthetase [Parabacteroides sp. PH5-13]MDH6323753.1 long-chain acyl-CoA synthetase [Parabacteroides sp. PH5-8]MDH6327691.1 long-chain acyl-CoA synthetase [Parabacteroides sp. PH5-41]
MKRTLVDLFESSVAQYPSNTFLLEKTKDEFEPTTYSQTKEQVYTLGAGLVALGVSKGDNMALLSEGRNAWIISELAMFYAGATNVPLSVKLEEANDLLFRLQHADVKYIMVSGQQLKKIRAITAQLPLVEKVIILDEQSEYLPGEISLAEVKAMGEQYLKDTPVEDFLSIGRSLQNDDYATITYTSGTTADPKGVILTHRNYTANIEQSLSCIDITQDWRTFVILPLDHCFAHVVGFYIFMSKGAAVATVQVGRTGMETLKNIPGNIKEVKPYLILSVPALAKNFKKSIEQGIQAQGPTVVRLFNLGLKAAYAYNGDGGDDKGRGWRFILKPFVALMDKLVFSKVRLNFGGELRFFIGGGALLDKDLQKFYYAIGMPMYQGYGLSEATPVISTNGPRRHLFGSSGVLVQPLDLKICDNDGKELPDGEKGEIVIRGENVMAGYWKNPVASAETVRDGWLYTGDMGYMKDGLLFVLGRFKSLLISSDGEKYSPEGIEEALMEHSPAIDQLLLYNNQNPYTVAILVSNKDYLKKELAVKQMTLDTAEGKQEAIDIIRRQIDRFKKGGDLSTLFPDRWLPTTFAVLPEAWTEQNGLVNSSLKVIRGKVEKLYASRIEHLYTPEGKNPQNEKNITSL